MNFVAVQQRLIDGNVIAQVTTHEVALLVEFR